MQPLKVFVYLELIWLHMGSKVSEDERKLACDMCLASSSMMNELGTEFDSLSAIMDL